MCIRQTATFELRATSIAPGVDNARTSFIMSTPAEIASAITIGELVSIDKGISRFFHSLNNRNRSVKFDIWCHTCCPWSSRFSTNVNNGNPVLYIRLNSVKNLRDINFKKISGIFEKSPPSENESGVTFMTPIHRGIVQI